MLNKVKTIVKYIDEIGFSVSASIMTIVTVYGVIMRYFIRKPILWGDELNMILIVWCIFFGASAAFRERSHIAVDVLYDLFPRKLRAVLCPIIWATVAYSIVWLGQVQVNRTMQLLAKNQATIVLHFPKYVTYGVVAFCCLLMLISHIIVGIEDLQHFFKTGKEGEDK